jgi:hypothetical protein
MKTGLLGWSPLGAKPDFVKMDSGLVELAADPAEILAPGGIQWNTGQSSGKSCFLISSL